MPVDRIVIQTYVTRLETNKRKKGIIISRVPETFEPLLLSDTVPTLTDGFVVRLAEDYSLELSDDFTVTEAFETSLGIGRYLTLSEDIHITEAFETRFKARYLILSEDINITETFSTTLN